MPLLSKMYAVIGQRDVPSSGIGKTDTQPPGKSLAALGEGSGIFNHDVMYRGWITPKNITS